MMTSAHTHTNRCWWDPETAGWTCPRDSRDTTDARSGPSAETALVDVRDMIVVHTALLREFRIAPAAVDRVVPGDAKQAATVNAHLRLLCDLLHHHHAGEEALLMPKLRSRVPSSSALIDDAETQHERIDQTLVSVRQKCDQWSAHPYGETSVALANELRALHGLLGEHLDLEEQAVLPLAASVLVQGEWDAIGEAAVVALPKSRLALVFGMFAYEADPVVLRAMLSKVPAAPRLLLARLAPRLYSRHSKRIHGTSQP